MASLSSSRRRSSSPARELPPVQVLMDESGNGDPTAPLIVGGVAVSREVEDLESDIWSLCRQWQAQSLRFGATSSFKDFKQHGFHGGQMPVEVQLALTDFLASRLDFKVFMISSNGRRMNDIDQTKRLTILYTVLLTDLLIRLRNHRTITVLIEQNEDLRPHIGRILETAISRAKSKSTAVKALDAEVRMVPKNQPLSLSIIDFYMRITRRWMLTGLKRDHDSADYRNFAALESSMSLLKSFEDGVISTRSARASF